MGVYGQVLDFHQYGQLRGAVMARSGGDSPKEHLEGSV